MENNITTTTKKEIIHLDISKILNRMLSLWWLFLLSIGIAYATATIYLKYTTSKYTSRAIMLIKDAGKSGKISTQDILSVNEGLPEGKSIDNEIQILKSLNIHKKVVERLKLHVQYFRIDHFKEVELYTSAPFIVDTFQLNQASNFGHTFLLELSDQDFFLFKHSNTEKAIRCQFGVPFETEQGTFRISKTPQTLISSGNYKLVINNVEAVANDYKFGVFVQLIGNPYTSSMLELSLTDPVAQKASDVINTLVDIYSEEEIKENSVVLESTLQLINERVENLATELDSIEGDIQIFKSNNQIVNDNVSSSMDYAQQEVRSSLQQLSGYKVEKNLLATLEQLLLADDFKSKLIPVTLIADNQIFSNLITEYNSLVVRNKQMSTTASIKNPSIIELETKIADTRNFLLQTIKNQYKNIEIPVKEIESNLQSLKNSMSSVPQLEKKLLEKKRTQEAKEKLYLFLLQKKEETALSEAVTASKIRIIEKAAVANYSSYPKKKFIKSVSSLLGFLFPLLLILVLEFFDNKIDSINGVQQLTSIPILGWLPKKKGKDKIVIEAENNNSINELFRTLRMRLHHIDQAKSNKVMLISSPGEGNGKTFLTANLGITLSLTNKKVLLVDLNLRKPKLSSYLDVPEEKGVINYLNKQSSFAEIIKPYKDNNYLFYIPSGGISKEPTELLLSNQLKKLLQDASQQFDYILIDTPPIGLVSDALSIREFVDTMYLVIRHQHTEKEAIEKMEELYKSQELPNAYIIYNGGIEKKSLFDYFVFNKKKSGYYV